MKCHVINNDKRRREALTAEFALNIGDRVFFKDETHRYFGTITGRRRGYSPRGGPYKFIYYTVKNEHYGDEWESYPMGSELYNASTGERCWKW